MSATAPDRHLFVDDVVTALTGTVDRTANAKSALKAQMKRAAADFDKRTAEAFARALLEHLCENSDDLRSLEALLILGLAHPHILDKHRISLETEGQRLALLLQRAGEPERARSLLETLASEMPPESRIETPAAAEKRAGMTAEQIERYLREADEAAASGKLMEAVAWLQEVVLLDRNRRDVARMIRDLRFQETERKVVRRTRWRWVASILLAAGLVAGIVLRERDVASAYAGIPSATTGDLASLRARLDAIDALVGRQYVWLGMYPALLERGRLRAELLELEEQAAVREQELAFERQQREQDAEDARVRGLMFVEQGRFAAALADFRRALEASPPGWKHRERVAADVDAIQAWIERKP